MDSFHNSLTLEIEDQIVKVSEVLTPSGDLVLREKIRFELQILCHLLVNQAVDKSKELIPMANSSYVRTKHT